jgi:hypothetical protein
MNDEQEEQKQQSEYNYSIEGQRSFIPDYNDLGIDKTIVSEKFLILWIASDLLSI